MIILFVLIIIAILAIIVWKIITKNYGKIICIYQTFKDNETIELINIYEDNENMKFHLIINEEKFKQTDIFTFEKPGNHTVSFVFKKKLKSLEFLFKEKESLIEADLSQLEYDEIFSLKGTFIDCINLKKVKFDFIGSNIINDTSNLFRGCNSLESFILNFSTEKIIDMRGLFENCTSLRNIDLKSFNTNNLKYMDFMFNGCENLEYLDLTNFNLENVQDMTYTFQNCNNLLEIKLPKSYTYYRIIS